MKKHILIILSFLLGANMLLGQAIDNHMQTHQGIHKFELKDVLQTKNYTYLLADEDGKIQWLAVPRMEASVGETYFYKGGHEMVNFKSTELDRTFASVLFLSGVLSKEEFDNQNAGKEIAVPPGAAEATSGKSDVQLEAAAGGVTIKQLFSDPAKYSGKTVRVKGEVTKFSSSIMSRNWVHLQDGTEHEGKFDFVVTTDETVEVGKVIVLEGIIATKKDFGYGYFYEVIMEEAKVVK